MPNLATWFTPSLQTISRSSGRSSVLAAAYRACVKLTDERLGITTDYTPKGKHGLAGNICVGIPDDDIGKLWNDAEESETRANSTVARELMIPLASEWNDHERRECVRAIAQMLRDEYGVAVLASIHRPARDNKNDHAHILFTTRTVDTEGNFGKKTRILDDAKTGEVKKMRERVCAIVNEHALANGSDWYVYAGKFADVLKDHIPTKHISISSGKNQRQYIEANREEVGEAMAAITKTKSRIAAMDAEILELQKTPVVEESSHSTLPAVDDSYWDSIILAPAQKRLERITMPCGAELAQLQLEKAHFAKADRLLQLQEWEKHKEKLSNSAPVPEYNFLGWPKKRYKDALAEHLIEIQRVQAGADACTEKLAELNTFIANPERNRLANAYHQTLAHNAQVDAEDRRLAEESMRESQRMNAQENWVDWSAKLRESEHAAEIRRSRATATTYGDDGFGM
jgi:hypothetical protein